MIENFSDHSANERTFLAWVRTSIAVMAFGFLIERFDLVIRLAIKATGEQKISVHPYASDLAGLAFILMGLGMIIAASARFRRIAAEIDRRNQPYVYGSHIDLGFVSLFVLLSCAMFLFLFHGLRSFL